MKRVSFNLDKNKIYLFHNYYPSNKYTTQNNMDLSNQFTLSSNKVQMSL